MSAPFLNDIIISAPFGNYLKFPLATSTVGTFTLRRRGGAMKRLWRCALTLRPLWRAGGFINKLGLPNPGIHSIRCTQKFENEIVSVHGFDQEEWRHLAYCLIDKQTPVVELNLSCPNVGHTHYLKDIFMKQIEECVGILLRNNVHIIAKLPPVKWMVMARPLWAMGVRAFHCCNTIPTPNGGVSGSALKNYSMWAVEEIKQEWGHRVRVIGGGGVHGPDDVQDYWRAGADHVAIGSGFMTFNPRKFMRLRAICKKGHDKPESDSRFLCFSDKCEHNTLAEELKTIAHPEGENPSPYNFNPFKEQARPSEPGCFQKGENDGK